MISGKKKPFVQGKSFKFPAFIKASDIKKGKTCTNCVKYKKNEYFPNDGEECKTCLKENEKEL